MAVCESKRKLARGGDSGHGQAGAVCRSERPSFLRRGHSWRLRYRVRVGGAALLFARLSGIGRKQVARVRMASHLEGGAYAVQAAHAGGTTAIADPATLDPRHVGAIIMIDAFTPGLHAQPLTDWLAGSQWNELSFAESYRYVGDIRKPSIGADVVRHKVMVPVENCAYEQRGDH